MKYRFSPVIRCRRPHRIAPNGSRPTTASAVSDTIHGLVRLMDRLASGSAAQFFDDDTHDDLNDQASDTAANKVASQSGKIDPAGGCCAGTAQQASQQLTTAKAAKGADYRVHQSAHVRSLDGLTASRTAERTANQLCQNLFHFNDPIFSFIYPCHGSGWTGPRRFKKNPRIAPLRSKPAGCFFGRPDHHAYHERILNALLILRSSGG